MLTILLTAKDEETDKITGLTLGADDYITKPFRPLELIARVKSQLRRYKKYNPAYSADEEKNVSAHFGLVMNVKTQECFLNEKSLVLTPTEFSILQILLENKGKVISVEELFHRLWQDEYYSKSNNTITVHIRRHCIHYIFVFLEAAGRRLDGLAIGAFHENELRTSLLDIS